MWRADIKSRFLTCRLANNRGPRGQTYSCNGSSKCILANLFVIGWGGDTTCHMLHCHRNCVCVGMSGGTPCKKWWRRCWPKAIFSRWRSNSRRAAAVSSNKKRRRRTRHRRRRALPQTGLFPSSFHPSRPAGCNSGPLRDLLLLLHSQSPYRRGRLRGKNEGRHS